MSQQISSPHYDYLDLAKGIGIILVVLGHGMFPCHFAIDVFHMPLFFFLAGITFKAPTVKSLGTFILKKINRIFIPFIFFSLISALFEIIFGRLSPNAPFNAPLWFLPTIFIALIIYASVLIVVHKRKMVSFIAVVLMLTSYVIIKFTDFSSVLPFSIVRAFAAVFFIHFGYVVSQRLTELNSKHSIRLLLIALFLYFAGLIASLIYFNTTGCSFVNGKVYTYCLPLFLTCAFSGIFATLFLSKIIGKIPSINWLGSNSLVVLCVHFPVIERLNTLSSKITPPYYMFANQFFMRCVIAIIIYSITFSFACLMIHLCKKYIPKLTGYANLIEI